MTHIPDDVLTVILIRLPVNSLLRFRCVSKEFCAQIDDPKFIKSHLKHSLLTKINHKLLLKPRGKSGLYSGELYSLGPSVKLDHPFKLHSTAGILGSVNGILCLHNNYYQQDNNYYQDILIWNPTTRNYYKPPLPNFQFSSSYPYYSWQTINYGFGYDSVSDDYKLLRLILLYYRFNSSYCSKAEVYSLRSNSWQRIQDFPYFLSSTDSKGKQACGALHWIVSLTRNNNDARLIAAFDLATNTYRLVDKLDFLSDICENGLGYGIGVWELGGLLSVTCNYNDVTDVWVMKDYGVKESWSKLFSLYQPKGIYLSVSLIPLAYSNDGDKIIFHQETKKLSWYNLIEERVEDSNIDICGLPLCLALTTIYVETLVSVGGKLENCSKVEVDNV